MMEAAKEAFASCNYGLAVEMYERSMKQQSPNLELLIGYGDALARCGRIRDAVDVFARCVTLAPLPLERLKHLTLALLEDITGATPITAGTTMAAATVMGKRLLYETSFSCPTCEGTLSQPVTSGCGHTYCRNCYETGKSCRACGQKLGPVTETNVLVQRLVEKWWPREAEASRARHEGDLLLKDGHPAQALERYDLAVRLAPNSPLHFSNRANVLLILNRPQASLNDADHAVRLRPDWGKGHYRRGVALSALGRHEEAFVAFCTSVAIDKNAQNIRHEITRVLHRVLLKLRRSTVATRGPYVFTESSVRLRRTRDHHHHHNHHYHNNYRASRALNSSQRHRRPALNSSDCEDNSSSEEEFTQAICRRVNNNIPQGNVKLHILLDRIYQEVEKLKRIEPMPAEILLPPLSGSNAVATGDLDCILCCRLLWKPVTTPCGHTYCWMCLDRCLDYSSACPLCVTSLADYLASNQKTVTEFIEKALKTIAPTEYSSRATNHRLELIQDLGLLGNNQHNIAVFVCTTAFPCVACPLFVYEPRYRLMVRRCVESGVRHFGIAACLNREATGSKRYAEYGTVLEIKDRVLMKDGCSILSTMGGRRFRVLSGGERDGYDTAEVELIRDSPIPSESLSTVRDLHDKVWSKGKKWWSSVSAVQQEEIERVFGVMPGPEEDWIRLPDGPSWTWWILAILPLGPQLQVGILGTTSLEKRLRAIEKTLNHMEKRQLTITAAPAEDTTTSSSICQDDNDLTHSSVSVMHS
ncbi:LON peptidase N-terminal domain and RING finger protein 3 [Microplitis mediator]|uniref:LON peptidase N-terminal domain and RING finger protein 3 n=1 Tax=Microplitis mediator TaxID=375433 RepID=UPI00255639F6|nr:LON peptidase N-terminal domain and RING finger protein 3 [Microplitis mediator]